MAIDPNSQLPVLSTIRASAAPDDELAGGDDPPVVEGPDCSVTVGAEVVDDSGGLQMPPPAHVKFSGQPRSLSQYSVRLLWFEISPRHTVPIAARLFVWFAAY